MAGASQWQAVGGTGTTVGRERAHAPMCVSHAGHASHRWAIHDELNESTWRTNRSSPFSGTAKFQRWAGGACEANWGHRWSDHAPTTSQLEKDVSDLEKARHSTEGCRRRSFLARPWLDSAAAADGSRTTDRRVPASVRPHRGAPLPAIRTDQRDVRTGVQRLNVQRCSKRRFTSGARSPCTTRSFNTRSGERVECKRASTRCNLDLWFPSHTDDE